MSGTSLSANRGRSPGWPPWLLRVVGGLALAAVWELGGRTSQSLLLPTFLETLSALGELLVTQRLWAAVLVSNQALVIGYGAALLAGLPLGAALGRWLGLARWADPWLQLLLVIPTTALVPVVFILAGPGLTTRALMVGAFATPIVVQCARTAIRDVDPHLIDIARSFCASRGQIWMKVILRAATPGLLLGARLGLARAVEGMVVVELLLVAVGVGGLLLDYQGRFEAAHVYAVILVVIAEAAVLSHAGRRLEHYISPATAGRGWWS